MNVVNPTSSKGTRIAISHLLRAESSVTGLPSSRFFSLLFWKIVSIFSSTLFKMPAPFATLCKASVLNCSPSKIGADGASSAFFVSTTGSSGMISGSTGATAGSSGCVSGFVSGIVERLTSGTFLNKSSASEPFSSSSSGVSSTSSGHSSSCASAASG